MTNAVAHQWPSVAIRQEIESAAVLVPEGRPERRIVGLANGCGLACSIFLSDLGVDHALVERHRSTSTLPKAHYLNQRTMEIFRQHGVADSVYAVGAPLAHFGKVNWVTSHGEAGPLYGRTIAAMDALGGNSLTSTYFRTPVSRTL